MDPIDLDGDGCGQVAWNHLPRRGLHSAAIAVLRRTKPFIHAAAIERVAHDPEGWEGVVRWLLLDGEVESITHGRLLVFRQSALRHGLTHPVEFNRLATLTFLESVRR